VDTLEEVPFETIAVEVDILTVVVDMADFLHHHDVQQQSLQ